MIKTRKNISPRWDKSKEEDMSRRDKGVSAFESRVQEAEDELTRKEQKPKHKSVWADVMGDDKVSPEKKAKLRKKFSGKDHPKMPETRADFLKFAENKAESAFEGKIQEAARRRLSPKAKAMRKNNMSGPKKPLTLQQKKNAREKKRFGHRREDENSSESAFDARISGLSEEGISLDEALYVDEEVLGDAAITEMMEDLGLDEEDLIETVLLDEGLKKMVFGVWRTVKAIGQSAKSKETGKGLGKGQAGTKGQKKGKKRGFVAGAMRTAMASKIKKHRRGEKTKLGKALTKASKNMREPEKQPRREKEAKKEAKKEADAAKKKEADAAEKKANSPKEKLKREIAELKKKVNQQNKNMDSSAGYGPPDPDADQRGRDAITALWDKIEKLKKQLKSMKESSRESSFDARIASLSEKLDPTSQALWNALQHLKDEYEISPSSGVRIGSGRMDMRMSEAKMLQKRGAAIIDKSSKGTYAYAQEDEMYKLIDQLKGQTGERWEDVSEDFDAHSSSVVKSLKILAKDHGGKSKITFNGLATKFTSDEHADKFIQDMLMEYPGIDYRKKGREVSMSPRGMAKFEESIEEAAGYPRADSLDAKVKGALDKSRKGANACQLFYKLEKWYRIGAIEDALDRLYKKGYVKRRGEVFTSTDKVPGMESVEEAVNFKGAAKVLLKKATDSKRPLGYTGYLRAVIQGNSEQATHMRSSKTYKDDASQAMQDLIDMAGKAKYDESLDEMFATLPKGVPDNYVTQNAIAIPAKITKVGNKVEFQFRDKNGLRVFKEVMKRGTVVLKDIDEKNNKVTISISMLKMVYVKGMKNTLENFDSFEEAEESVQEGDLEEATLTKGAKASLEAAMARLELVGKHFEKTNSNIYKEIMKAREKLKKGITWLRYKEEAVSSSKGLNLLKSLVNELGGLAKALMKDGYDSSAEMVEIAQDIIKKNITRLTGKKSESMDESPDVSGGIDNSAHFLDESIAKTILAQLGGNKFLAMTGAKNLVSTGKGLMFNIGRNSKKISKVVIDLDPSDTYSLKFYKGKGVNMKLVKEVDMIYADMLQDVFTMHTGLDTHL